MIGNSNDNQHSNSGRILAIIALVIAIIALTLAWMAYNRSGKDLENSITDSIEGTSQNAGQKTQQGLDTIENAIDTSPDGVDDGTQ